LYFVDGNKILELAHDTLIPNMPELSRKWHHDEEVIYAGNCRSLFLLGNLDRLLVG
jgi:hypothetical protein